MLEVTTEGIYESDIGSGQKKYEDFKYTFKTSRQDAKGLETHVMRRFIPLLVNNDKSKKTILFSRIKNFVICDIKEVEDDKNCIIGKEINTFDVWQLQDFAATFDLYKVPLSGACSIALMREQAILAYLEKVLKVPMKTSEEKSKIKYLDKQPDGSFKFDLKGDKILAMMPEGYLAKNIKKEEQPRKGISDFIKNAGFAVANGVLSATGNQTVQNNDANGNDNSDGNNSFPNGDNLLNGLNLNINL